MRIIKPSYEIITPNLNEKDVLSLIEISARTCYQSECTEDPKAFIHSIIRKGHRSVLEHIMLNFRFIVDRGVSHELVRHRNTAFSQESTRYCNYTYDKFSNEITVIEPFFFENRTKVYEIWEELNTNSEKAYFELINNGCRPQEARSVLTNSLKTTLVMSMNLRQARFFFSLRTEPDCHPQMLEVTVPCLLELGKILPTFFSDIVDRLDPKVISLAR